MGRKIEMKKIIDNTKCQVTFSKRRSSLIKKADEISVTCDVDVLLVAFSPSGRVSTFCSQERIEDFLKNYANLPVEKRLSNMKNVQNKMEKLQRLGNIRNEEGKLYYLNSQIENLEMQIKNQQIDVQLAEANLRDFELNPEQEASLHQLSWCERNLQQCYEKIKEIKKEKLAMEKQGEMQLLHNHHSRNNLHFAGLQEMQFEPWKDNQYIYPENIFNEILGRSKEKELAYAYGGQETTMKNNISYAPASTSYNMGQLGVPENLGGSSYNLWQSNTYNAQLPSSYAMMNHPGNAQNELLYSPSQDYQSGKQAPTPCPQLQSSFGQNFGGESSNFTQNHLSDRYLSAFPQSSPNYVKATWADASYHWDVPMLQNQPNTVLNNMDTDVNEAGNDNYNNKENEDSYNEMIVSPMPTDKAPLSASGGSNDLFDLLPSQDPLGDNAPWTN